MKRIVHATLGTGFTALGILFVLGFGLVLFRDHAPVAAVGIVLGAFTLITGLFTLTRLAYEVGCDEQALRLHFVFRHVGVPWSRVDSYRKLGVTWGLQTDGPRVRAGVFVILKYRRVKHGVPLIARAYFWLVGTGPAFSTSSADYFTALARYVPHKDPPRGQPGR